MDDDEFGADSEFLAALAASDPTPPQRVQQPTPQRISQPTPQRLDRTPLQTMSSDTRIVQPTPQAMGPRSSNSSIFVSPRQKGNPILSNLRSFAWEYADIPADYVVGLTTCALFLSLKYHRLHPEYIYNRIKGLQGKYNLRILLTLVDITNHEDSLKELSKTSLVNNVTVILCWSAAEAARYLELYKSYEHSSRDGAGIRGIEKKGYADKMLEFITVPRGINKTDAVSIVSAFGTIRDAVNARPEEVVVIGGWGEKKVRRWCGVVDSPFRARTAAKRRKEVSDGNEVLQEAVPLSKTPLKDTPKAQKELETRKQQQQQQQSNLTNKEIVSKPKEATEQFLIRDYSDDEWEASIAAAFETKGNHENDYMEGQTQAKNDDGLGSGIAAALANLRENESER